MFEEVRAEDRVIEGVPVRIYWPPNIEPSAPVVLFFHGGGWVVGDLDTYDGTARLHAAGTGAVVVSVDYRLAPEHPFPAAVDDVWAVTQWVAAHADEIGGDPNRLAVAGDSAGGNLAAVVAQLARDAGITLRAQLLWYPATTWDTSLPSFTEFGQKAFGILQGNPVGKIIFDMRNNGGGNSAQGTAFIERLVWFLE